MLVELSVDGVLLGRLRFEGDLDVNDAVDLVAAIHDLLKNHLLVGDELLERHICFRSH